MIWPAPGVGVVVVQSIGARTDDAAVDDKGFEIEGGSRLLALRELDGVSSHLGRSADFQIGPGRVGDRRSGSGRTGVRRAEAVFEMFQDVELVAGQRGFKAVGKADKEFFSGHGWRAGYDADRATRMLEGVVGAAYFNKRHDLRSGRDVVWLMGHSWPDNDESARETPASLQDLPPAES